MPFLLEEVRDRPNSGEVLPVIGGKYRKIKRPSRMRG
jgi:hypothetical protein